MAIKLAANTECPRSRSMGRLARRTARLLALHNVRSKDRVIGEACHFMMRDYKLNLAIVWSDGQLSGLVAYLGILCIQIRFLGNLRYDGASMKRRRDTPSFGLMFRPATSLGKSRRWPCSGKLCDIEPKESPSLLR